MGKYWLKTRIVMPSGGGLQGVTSEIGSLDLAGEPQSPSGSGGGAGSRKGRIRDQAMVAEKVDENYTFTEVPKSPEDTALVRNRLLQFFIFDTLTAGQQDNMVGVMFPVEKKAGEYVMTQDAEGDNMYVIEHGTFEVSVTGKGVVDTVTGDRSSCKNSAGKDKPYFGELALMHNAPRNASIRVTSPTSKLWALTRQAYQNICAQNSVAMAAQTQQFLTNVELLQGKSPEELSMIARALEKESFRPGETIVRQGDEGHMFYLLYSGEVECFQKKNADDASEKPVMLRKLKPGDYFGERALVGEKPIRTASCIASDSGPVDCLVMHGDDFKMLIDQGKIQERMTADDPNRGKFDGRVNDLGIEFTDLKPYKTLGAGAFGRVKLVEWQKSAKQPKETFALKCLEIDQIDSTGHKASILAEKRCMREFNDSSTHHMPFMPTLLATYVDESRLYMLMEVMLGGELFTFIQNKAPLPDQWVKFYAAQVVCVFEALHARGFIYRDLKPENIMIDQFGYCKVVDYGFAKQTNGELTHTMCGTPDYLPPEVVARRGHNKGFDWWTLGILIYEMLFSFPPFYADSGNNIDTYRNIQRHKGVVNFHPSQGYNPTASAKDIITALLRPNPALRLGCLKAGTDEVKAHAFFKGYDWQALLQKRYKAPYLPPIKNNLDVANFPDDYDADGEKTLPPYSKDKGWYENW